MVEAVKTLFLWETRAYWNGKGEAKWRKKQRHKSKKCSVILRANIGGWGGFIMNSPTLAWGSWGSNNLSDSGQQMNHIIWSTLRFFEKILGIYLETFVSHSIKFFKKLSLMTWVWEEHRGGMCLTQVDLWASLSQRHVSTTPGKPLKLECPGEYCPQGVRKYPEFPLIAKGSCINPCGRTGLKDQLG